MTTAIRNYLVFLRRCAQSPLSATGGITRGWARLSVICLLGLNAYCKQFVDGLIVTGMSDEVSWGVYIANFTFLVGVAAAAVMMVIPVYIYDNEDLHDLVIFGELLAVAAILMCLAFVTVDLGRPDRFWHLIPGHRAIQFPGLDVELGRAGAQRLPVAERAHLRLSAVLPVSGKEARQVVLHSLCLHRHRVGGFDSYGHGVPVCRPGWPAVLELRDRRSALSRLRVHRRSGADHPGAAGGAPGHRQFLRGGFRARAWRRTSAAGTSRHGGRSGPAWPVRP